MTQPYCVIVQTCQPKSERQRHIQRIASAPQTSGGAAGGRRAVSVQFYTLQLQDVADVDKEILGIVPKLTPKIMLNEEDEHITLSDNLTMFTK